MTEGLSGFQLHRKRADRAWLGRAGWDKLYADAYEFAMPQRRPGGLDRSKTQIDRLFDMTAIVSTFHFAGQLQQDLFPAGQPSFALAPGPFVKARLQPDEVKGLAKQLQLTSDLIHPFFLTGEWDQAVHEACLDLAIGTGGIYLGKGTPEQPLRFMSIPADELALELGPFGDVVGRYWKQKLPRQAVKDQFQQGRFPDAFLSSLASDPYGEVTLCQDFCWIQQLRRWKFVAYVADCQNEPIAENHFRASPVATPRYYRVAGEAYGRGPVLLAMPSIKTLNKAQELALKAAAIQMLGIWGYRAGGTFNPDTARVGAGEFWPMQSTGGILGPDVQRLDPAAGRLDVARLVMDKLQEQVRQTLLDNRLPDPEGTPASASEIVARLRLKKDAHLGAFGRLSREIVPVLVPRAMEILYEFGFLPNVLPIDELLISIEVNSPMAQALKADRLSPIMHYFEMVVATAGPQAVPLYLDLDKTLDLVASETQVPTDLVPSQEQRDQTRQQQQQVAVAAALAQAVGAGGQGAGGGLLGGGAAPAGDMGLAA